MEQIGIEDIRAARARIGRFVHRTPTVRSAGLSECVGADVFFKVESLQKTGSFKVRGALNRLLSLQESESVRSVVTVSAGNHAAASAYACSCLGIECTVVMPESAPPIKVEATRGYGAEVVLHDDVRTLFARCESLREERGAMFLHPFDDSAVIAGAATVGLEILEDDPEADLVIVPIGGGGLISGVARAVCEWKPSTRVIGVEPEGAPTLTRALAAGSPVRLETIDTVADGLTAPFAGERNLAIIQDDVDEVLLVRDEDIVRAVTILLERSKLVVEPAGAAGLVPLLDERVRGAGRDPSGPRRIHVVLSGGNLDAGRLAGWLG